MKDLCGSIIRGKAADQGQCYDRGPGCFGSKMQIARAAGAVHTYPKKRGECEHVWQSCRICLRRRCSKWGLSAKTADMQVVAEQTCTERVQHVAHLAQFNGDIHELKGNLDILYVAITLRIHDPLC